VLPAEAAQSSVLSPIAKLADITEEEIWLVKRKSKRTRRAYKLDVRHFMRTLHITSYEELCKVDPRAVIAWERIMREVDEAEPSTIRRRLAVLSSLFKTSCASRSCQEQPGGRRKAVWRLGWD
jgi:site-specific recombinase XerD